jgi:hypothetical protein
MRSAVETVVREWDELTQPKNLGRLQLLLPPGLLSELTHDEMEALLQKLPQWGALRGRRPGDLRIVSLGFHAHVQGTVRDCPYPVDFFTRLRGAYASVNLVMRIVPAVHRPEVFRGKAVGSCLDLLEALRIMQEHGMGLHHLELLLHRVYRPGAPNGFHWGTPGGVQEPTATREETAMSELAQEAGPLTVLASRVLLPNQLYQSGNLPEAQTLVGVLCVGAPAVTATARQEGIAEYIAIPVLEARRWLRDACALLPESADSMLPDGKIWHALNEFLLLCHEHGVS